MTTDQKYYLKWSLWTGLCFLGIKLIITGKIPHLEMGSLNQLGVYTCAAMGFGLGFMAILKGPGYKKY